MGLKSERERLLVEYLEYGRAVAMLASLEDVSISYAASWLIQHNAHVSLPCYVRSTPRAPSTGAIVGFEDVVDEHVAYVVNHPSFDKAPPFTDGPLDILDAIAKCDNLWWNFVGWSQKFVDQNQRWKKDEFWEFVFNNGVLIDQDSFENVEDCPNFLSKMKRRGQTKRRISRHIPYKGSAPEWRELAKLPHAVSQHRSPDNGNGITILDRIRGCGFPIECIERDVGHQYRGYIANLIMRSGEVAMRSMISWEFKSVLEFIEEQFVLREGEWYLGVKEKDFEARDWYGHAIKGFSRWLLDVLLFEADGLQLYVKDGKFREARPGDAVYEFVRRLRDDGGFDSVTYSAPPAWASELYLGISNYEAYRLAYHQTPVTSSPEYGWFKREKTAMIRRETAYRMALRSSAEPPHPVELKARFQDSTNPFFAPELDVAVAAWEAVTSSGTSSPEGVAAKTAILNWLLDAYPSLPKDTRDRIATVANWNKRGGATKTPG